MKFVKLFVGRGMGMNITAHTHFAASRFPMQPQARISQHVIAQAASGKFFCLDPFLSILAWGQGVLLRRFSLSAAPYGQDVLSLCGRTTCHTRASIRLWEDGASRGWPGPGLA